MLSSHDPLTLARSLRSAPALTIDPRPGTRPLADTALGALNIELLACEADHVAARVQLADQGEHGGFGVLLVAAETVASTAANLRCDEHHRAFGAELDAARIAAPCAGPVIVVATELVVTQDHQVWRVAALDSDDQHVLEGRCTLSVLATPR